MAALTDTSRFLVFLVFIRVWDLGILFLSIFDTFLLFFFWNWVGCQMFFSFKDWVHLMDPFSLLFDRILANSVVVKNR